MEMTNLKKGISYTMVSLVMVFTLTGLLAIWGVLTDEVVSKSFSTLGLLFLASLISFVIIRLLEK